MFAMLQGAWPRVLSDGTRLAEVEGQVTAGRSSPGVLEAAIGQLVAEVVAAQHEAGLGLVTDGSVRWADPELAILDALRDGDTGPSGMLVRAWRAAAACTEVPVAQVVPGPWTLALRSRGIQVDGPVAAEPRAVASHAEAIAEALAGELTALEAAGCPVVEINEPGATDIGADPAARAGFVSAHRRLLAEAPGLHAMLLITGGAAHRSDADAIFAAPYRSFLFDLVAGPDNWYLVRAAPADRGIVCAALVAGDGAEERDQAPQLVWAARYAAASGGRGPDRIGLANASSLAIMQPEAARRALDALVRAARLAALPLEVAVEAGLDPRAVRMGPSRPPAPGDVNDADPDERGRSGL